MVYLWRVNGLTFAKGFLIDHPHLLIGTNRHDLLTLAVCRLAIPRQRISCYGILPIAQITYRQFRLAVSIGVSIIDSRTAFLLANKRLKRLPSSWRLRGL